MTANGDGTVSTSVAVAPAASTRVTVCVALCRRFREIPELAAVPVIFVTGTADEEDLVRCFEAGAIMGRAPADGRTGLRGYARDVGLAFQIADDLIDHEGLEEKAGKRVGKDREAGKQTFVSLLGPERARRQADLLVEQAIAHLHGFGEDADLLRAVARFAVERDH